MLDEVRGQLKKPDRGRVAGGEASRRGYCGHCQLGSITGYSLHTAPGSHPAVPAAQAI